MSDESATPGSHGTSTEATERTALTELSGWKQIARYLHVSQPTARKYYRLKGLPVVERNRRYFAFAGDLDRWRRQGPRATAAESDGAQGSERRSVPDRRRLRSPVLGALLLVVLVAAGAATWLTLRQPGALRRVVAEGEDLVAFDASGSEIWRRHFPGIKPPEDGKPAPLVVDVDQDGHNEVLFDVSSRHPERSNGHLLCLDHRGRQRWEFTYGRAWTLHGRYLEPMYVGHHLRWLETGGHRWILVIARHATWFPAQIALLDPASGKLVSEYWHPGYINAVEAVDLDGDGKSELLLGGTNNPGEGLGHASLAVLDLPFAAPRDEPSYFGSANARERSYLLFPRPEIFTTLPALMNVVQINPQGPDRLQVVVGADGKAFLDYYLDHALRVLDVRPTDQLVVMHDRAFTRGLIDHRLSEEELLGWRKVQRFRTAPDGNGAAVERRFATADP